MSLEHLKTPIARSLPQAISKGAADANQQVGKNLPCSVTEVIASGIVRVKFEINAAPFTLPEVVVPVFMSEYVRLPIQVGCKGVTISADAYTTQMSGLSEGVAGLTTPGNLSALHFMPIGDKAWAAVSGDTLGLYGVTEAFLANAYGGPAAVTLTEDSAILSYAGGSSVTCDADGVKIDGTLFINGVEYLDHTHSAVMSGSDDSGPVTP